MGAIALSNLRPGLLRLVTNKEIARQESVQETQSTPQMLGLAAHIASRWSAAQRAKIPIEQQMLANLRQRNGIYEPSKLAEIRTQGGSEIYMMLTSSKCRAAQALLRDTFLAPERSWTVEPTPIPSLPGHVEAVIEDQLMREAMAAGWAMEEGEFSERMQWLKTEAMRRIKELAADIASRMEGRMHDQLVEGGWYQCFPEFLYDFVTYKAGIIKGPILRRRKRLSWGRMGDQFIPVVKEEVIPEFERRSPFNIYPAPRSRGPQHSYLLDLYDFSREDLQAMKGVSGYSEEAIDQVIFDYGEKGIEMALYNRTELAQLENRSLEYTDPQGTIQGLNYWGSASGQMLLEWGGKRANWRVDLDPRKEYQIEAWQVGRYVIKAVLNPDPLGRKPYGRACFEKIPGTWWGKGLPEIIADAQDMCNGAARALANNEAIACLTGDTVVYRDAKHRAGAPITLNELWRRKHEHNSGLRRSKLRSLDEATGAFFGNRIVDVIDNGIADVFEVLTEKGYKIKATNNHRFMREDGEWQQLAEFDDGDLIAVNGQVVPLPRVCVECGGPKSYRGLRCRKCASQIHNSAWNQRQVEAARSNRSANDTTARARLECKRSKKKFCEDCGARTPESAELHVHHRDRDPWNNVPWNLLTLCEPCHRARHAREDSFGDPYLHKYVSYDRIVAIRYIGRERVFDLAMEGPNHNFVANGFVSHNSGPQVEITVDRLAEGAKVTNLYPWKIHQTVSDPSGSTARAVNFFQPQSNAEELMRVYNFFSDIADVVSNIPRYTYGDTDVGGAGRTASGLSMLMGTASKGFKDMVAGIDTDVTEDRLQHLYEFDMEYDPDPSIKGDLRVQAKGQRRILQKEQEQQRRAELLQATANRLDAQIMGMEGRREMLRETLIGANLPAEKILPSKERLALEAAKLPPPYQMVGRQGPNLPALPGMTPGGGSPSGPQTLDQAGNPVQGTDVRQFNQ